MLPYYGNESEIRNERAVSLGNRRRQGGRDLARPSDMMGGGISNIFNEMMESHNKAIKKFDEMSNQMMGLAFGSK